MPGTELLARYADMVVNAALRLEPGQLLAIDAFPEQADIAAAVAEAAYAAGARYVDIWYFETRAKRARLRHAPEASLSWVPPWYDARVATVIAERGAFVRLAGDPVADLLQGVDSRRGGLDVLPVLSSKLDGVLRRAFAWVVVPGPTPGWARTVLGEADVERLWNELVPMMRLDHDDPRAALDTHAARLRERAAALATLELDALRFRGPGTDLLVGLLPQSRWCSAEVETTWGQVSFANVPSEEVFTTPDYRRTEGVARLSRPLAMRGVAVREAELRFERGRVVDVRGGDDVAALRTHLEADEGASRLGEVALVDGDSPVARSGRVWGETLLDENAACHIALGAAYREAVEGADGLEEPELAARGVNVSSIHTDVMIGGPELDVDGLTRDGRVVEIMRREAWRLGR